MRECHFDQNTYEMKNEKIIEFVRFSYYLNCLTLGHKYNNNVLDVLFADGDHSQLTADDVEFIRLIKLFVFYDIFAISVAGYFEDIYESVESYKGCVRFGPNIGKFKHEASCLFVINQKIPHHVYIYNVCTTFLSLTLIHELTRCNISSTVCDDLDNYQSDDVDEPDNLYYGHTSLISIVASTVKKIDIWLRILKTNNLVCEILDESILYKHVFRILKHTELLCSNKRLCIKIVKTLKRTGNIVSYSNVLKHNIAVNVNNELYFNIFYTKPTVLLICENYVVFPAFVLFGTKLIKNIINKKHSVITADFVEAFKISMSVEYYVDVGMLDIVLNEANARSLELKKLHRLLVDEFCSLRLVEQIDDLIINNITDFKLYLKKILLIIRSNRKVESYKLADKFIDSENYTNSIYHRLWLSIKDYNETNNLNIQVPAWCDLKTFFCKNKIIFSDGRWLDIWPELKKKTNYSDMESIKFSRLLSAITWSVFKEKGGDSYTTYVLNVSTLEKLILDTTSIISMMWDVELFTSYRVYILQKCNKPIYFINFSDSRGRLYMKSSVSIQDNWLFRYIYNFGNVDYDYFTLNKQILPTYVTVRTIERVAGLGFNESTIDIFLAIGLIFKSKVRCVNGHRKFLDTIELGITIYNEYVEDKSSVDVIQDIDDRIALRYYLYILDNIKNKNIKLWYIIKDTTASVHQHTGNLLGFKQDALKYLNLDNDSSYYDTYELFISELLKKLIKLRPGSESDLIRLLKRKILKKTIMTVAYSVGFVKAREDFLLVIKAAGYSTKDTKFLIGLYPKIYFFFKGCSVDASLLYNHTKSDFLKKLFASDGLKLSDILMPTEYYKLTPKDIRFYTNGDNVYTLTFLFTNFQKDDCVKTRLASFVNCVHALDASYLRRIIILCHDYNIPVGTIHDGFCVPFFKSGTLIHIANRAFIFNATNIIPDLNINIIKKNSFSILL